MHRNVVPVGYKLVGDDPQTVWIRPVEIGTPMIQVGVKWGRGRSRRLATDESPLFGDRIIL